MADNFHVLADAVRQRFEELSHDKLFVVDSDNDDIWNAYLSAFPAGSDPIFRERRTHDCSCCRAFIRSIGNVVGIQNGTLASIWDLNGLPYPYQDVADAMSAYVKSRDIRDVFLTSYAKHGTPQNHAMIGGERISFTHLAVNAPRNFVVGKAALDTMRGNIRTTVQVLARGVAELDPDAVATVANLIEENAIYRGQEFKRN